MVQQLQRLEMCQARLELLYLLFLAASGLCFTAKTVVVPEDALNARKQEGLSKTGPLQNLVTRGRAASCTQHHGTHARTHTRRTHARMHRRRHSHAPFSNFKYLGGS